MDGIATVTFFDTEARAPGELFETVADTLEAAGTTFGNDRSEFVTGDCSSANDRVDTSIGLRGKQVYVTVQPGVDGTVPDPFLEIATDDRNLEYGDGETVHENEFRTEFIDLIGRLGTTLDPVFVSSFSSAHATAGPAPKLVTPTAVPIDIERIPWLGIYSEPIIEQLGGRQRVLETPAWVVEELDNGNILMITTKEPWAGYRDKQPADEYLLDGDDDATLAEESDDFELSDPFAALAPGEYGTDVCVYRDDIAAEFRNEDLELVRVYVDEAGDLRRISDDAFVRNVVRGGPDDKVAFVKRMLAGVPADANDDDLMVSPLLRGPIPPAFVHAEGPEVETVASKVIALDAETNKIDLLISLARAARQREDVDAAVQSIETALDELSALEDVDGLDRWIEENLL